MHWVGDGVFTGAKGIFVSAILAFSLLFSVRGHAATLPTGFSETDIGGTWNEAVGLTFASDGRMYVWERIGKVWIVENGVKSATPFLDISDEVAGYRDFGLLGFTLHPDFYNNGFVYLLYTVDRHHLFYAGTGNYNASSNLYYQATIGRITRYTVNSTNGFRSVLPASRKILLGDSRTNGFPMLYESHGVGTILFGTDGTLLASCGDGASYSSQDTGSAAETYYQQALNDGIIRNKENVGAYRSQLVDCLNGKVIRIDPDTGDGIPSNPFYNATAPKSARSRVWALGFRNPYRMTLRQGTGSHIQSDGKPGVLYVGDVGNGTWEELNVCDRPGQNFGWPVFEGLTSQAGYSTANTLNQDATNTLYNGSTCNQRYFYFRDLIKQDSLLAPSWPHPCNTNQQIPTNFFRFVHARPSIDWRHGQNLARTGNYTNNQATVINVGAAGSPVTGTNFGGNSVTAGSWYTNTAFPALYRNTFFAGDYAGQWIRNFSFSTNDKPTAVRPFTDNPGGVVDIKVDPFTGDLYYITWTANLRRIRYLPSGNQPPVAVASANTNYGPAPLTVQLSSAGSSDPENQPLTYSWNFGDGTPNSTNANPSHTFNTTNSAPITFTVTLVVTDKTNASATNRVLISVNNTPPQVTITSPVNGTLYTLSNSTTYNCTAIVTDAEHGSNQRTCVWTTILHHNNHTHSEPPDTNCTTTALISPIGCNGETYYYRIVLTVTDAGGLSTTKEVMLYPNCFPQPPVITNAPQSQTVLISNNAAFSVIAGGDSPLIYRWRKNGMNLANQTNTTLILNNVQLADAGNYTVVVSNSYGVVTGAPAAVLTVIAPPSVLVTNPISSAVFPWSSNIVIGALASAIGTNVSLVEFYANGNKLGEDNSNPYSLTWSNATAGVHQLTARVTDARAIMATSTVVTIIVSNIPPVANINTPTNGAAFPWSSNIVIAASASATGTNVALVEFFANGNQIGQDNTNPYGLSWSNAAAGMYQLTVKATDARNIAATSAIITVTVTNVPPTVGITAPTNGATFPWSSNISIAAVAFANGTNVALVEFLGDGNLLGQDNSSPYSFIWSNATAGVHQLIARATDARGIVATSAVVAITVTNVPPLVSISSPINGAAFPWSSNVVMAASASATGTNVALVEFFANGSKVGEDVTAPFSFTWSNASAGVHQLTAKVTDARNVMTTSAVVTITVTNVSPTVGVTAPANGTTFPWSSNILVATSASAHGTNVALVEFFADSNKLGEDSTSPYSFIWSNAAVGAHQLSAKVTDARALTATSAVVTVTVTNVLPQVTISAPADGVVCPVGPNVVISASASANGTNVALVEFFTNGSKLGEDSVTPFNFVWSNAPSITHQISAKVTDARGLTATSAVITMTVSNARPQVSLSTPTNGSTFTTPASISINAAATDSDGAVTKVEFFAGTTKLGEAGSNPYSITWSNAGVGNYQLTAVATDDDGGTATNSPVAITVAEPDLSFTNTLIAAGSMWKYLDDGSDQGAAWMAWGINDSSWLNGLAQLGYGDNDEATIVRSNRTDGTRIITTYFRRGFNVSDMAWYTNLALRVLRDDGVRVFLNGAEIFRNNLPTGTVAFATLATATVSGAAESTLFVLTNVNPSLLREGLNVVAAEIHQVTDTSPDISFDLELIGVGVPGQTIFLRAEPTAGSQFPLWFNAHPGRSYVIEASPDFQNWSPVSTNVPINGRVEYRDINIGSSNRFFRARQVP